MFNLSQISPERKSFGFSRLFIFYDQLVINASLVQIGEALLTSLIMKNLTNSGAAADANVFSESRSYISNIESNLNRSSCAVSTLTAIDTPSDFPRQCRALVRLELARDWHGPPGSYRESQLQTVERKIFPMREYGLVLFHNRLELTESLNSVDSILRFTPTTKLSMFSPIDGSIAISQEHPNEVFTSVYVFVFPTPTLARSWYMSLHHVMLSVRPVPDHITVSVPELDTKIQVLISSEKMSVWSVREAVLSGLEGEEAWETTLQRWREDKSAGICWKHLDRLEWIISEQNKLDPTDLVVTPQLIEGTHELQIRTMDHHPQATEPLAIEGYLIFRGYREKDPQVEPQSSRSLSSGRLQKGKPYYLATFRHQLAYVNANRFSKRLKGTRQPTDCIPYTFIEPCDRPGFDGHEQHWVDRQDPNAHSDLDFWRHVEGFIDFREVVSITQLGTTDPIFEIELCGSRWLRLEAWNSESMKEWITRLAQLHTHWRAQLQQDARQLVTYARLNTACLGEEGHDSLEPENSRILANPLLWRVCLPKHCFPVLNSGVLFVKESQHASFTKMHVVLTLDALHLFESSVSTYFADGECDGECDDFSPVDLNRLPSPHKLLHPRLSSHGDFSIPLQNCFAYSGYSLDLIDPESGDLNPRVFPDQLIASDTELDRSFGVWQSHLAYLWTPTPPNSSWISRWCTYVHRSLSCGHAWFWPWKWFRPHRGAQSRLIFQARSHSEMDHWVYTLNLAIDYWVQHRKWARSS
ncbi:hypothetical protein DSO57_1017938 [Entomophthora muscae]|uniref:Uncharacterized protein n=1 Tax=Entomophthora muscae TaxID=34485 RepID=A0ACC2RVJ3_9FUNG|nr:hypothetical protein DSO57_1017938 [Entomophthora muscae]